MGQHVWALRNPELGRVGPDTTAFFYTNLFELGVINPPKDQVIDVLIMCYEWLEANGIDEYHAVVSPLAYTDAGARWMLANEDWIHNGEETAKEAIAKEYGDANRAVQILKGCQYQALSLVASREVYLFVSFPISLQSDCSFSLSVPSAARSERSTNCFSVCTVMI